MLRKGCLGDSYRYVQGKQTSSLCAAMLRSCLVAIALGIMSVQRYSTSSSFFGVLQVFMVASDNGTTYNGLARSCSPVSRLSAVASGCPTTAFMDCYQVKKQPACPAQHLLSPAHSGTMLKPTRCMHLAHHEADQVSYCNFH